MNGRRPVRVATVFTHRRASETSAALLLLREVAERHGSVLRFSAEETSKHELQPGPGIVVDAPFDRNV